MQSLYGGRIVPHKRFNTAKWLLDEPNNPVESAKLLADLVAPGTLHDLPSHLDFVTARTEFYTAPTVLPTVEDSSIKLDLHRRDFTINTLALCLNPHRWGELLDFWGGINDLHARTIRILHSLSFVDDPTRILRAIRYEQRFRFTIEPRTLELLRDAIELLDRVTPTRIRHELERILQEEMPERALARLDELGVLQRIHAALYFDANMATDFVAFRAARAAAHLSDPLRTEPVDRLYWGIMVATLPPEAHVALTGRLGLRGETQQLMRGLAHLHKHRNALAQPDLAPSRVVTLFEPVDPVSMALLPIIYVDSPQMVVYATAYLDHWRHIHPELDGHDLHTLGIPRGPLYAELLRDLRAARLDGLLQTRADEIKFVHRRLAEGETPSIDRNGKPAL
jgi:tRNA nucleotidyltransferase (CCA-adding enzyme)